MHNSLVLRARQTDHVEWERDARHSALSRSVTHRYVTERYFSNVVFRVYAARKSSGVAAACHASEYLLESIL
ncbi:hypothetical protein EVAR_9334_1 [Eumeta japonica]|uniref:Uncharacterized protein n=1 Tax=Eumeta variegata TaxID=151549 RepID=A0A4C1TLV4_EUMVA|nr:hypothetical protein EVAR_9334_1 [Eumeta japonica]